MYYRIWTQMPGQDWVEQPERYESKEAARDEMIVQMSISSMSQKNWTYLPEDEG